ncbi:MAG TPA: hypothetical protein VEL03_20910 [Streptosporangiaceae bacterium]|nr:hypothetical protein [Streptosporangiaceae bacterium]
MAATEFEEVQALLERILPDPSGFAQRLLLQVMARWGEVAGHGSSTFNPDASAFYTEAEPEDVTASGIVITPDQPTAENSTLNTNLVLAAALGACECWGLRADCHLCWGQGSAGWTEPVPELFDEYVAPAIAKLSDACADNLAEHGSERPQDSDDYQTVEGARA